jgi:microcystin-dependent protein
MIFMRYSLSLFFLLISLQFASAQIGINNSNPDDNAALDIQATNKGLLIPRLSSTQREAMSTGNGFTQGMMVYDITLDILFVGYGNGSKNNTKWYAMNPWKTEHRSDNNSDTAHTTTMTAAGIKHGNVGIGEANPTEKLHVDGKVKATEFIGRGAVPIGTIVMWSGKAAPPGWALCNGSVAVSGYTTPNLKGRFVVGYDNGVADYNNPGNLSTKGISSSDVGGTKEVVLTNQQMPEHTHTGSTNSDGAHTHRFRSFIANFASSGSASEGSTKTDNRGEFTDNSAVLTNNSSHSHAFTTNPEGSGSAHENRPPYYTLAYIMRVY